jgi:hypothetical protein
MVLTLAVVEIALRFVDFPKQPEVGWRWEKSPYRSDANKDDRRVNQLELRGQPIQYGDQDFVILLVGDSQVEAGAQPPAGMPEALLERYLREQHGLANVRVFSVASAGWGQDQELLALRQYLAKYRADLVLVWLSPVNDYWENTFVNRSVTREVGKLKPTFRPTGSGAALAFPAGYRSKLAALARLALGRFKHGKDYSMIHMQAEEWDRTLPTPAAQPTPREACPAEEVPWLELRTAYARGKRHFTAVTDDRLEQGRSRFSPFLASRSARDDYMIDVSHALLGQMAVEAEAKGAVVRFFYPYRDDVDPIFNEVQCVKSLASGRTYAYNGTDFLRHLKASPLASRLVTVSLAGADLAVSGDDWHLNKAGNEAAMRQLARLVATDAAMGAHRAARPAAALDGRH